MRFLFVGIALLTLSFGSALAGPNPATTLPLHAWEGTFGPCPILPPSGPDPCDQGTLLTDVAIGTQMATYLMARNYDNVNAVQTAFDWPLAWVFTFGLWNCQSAQVSGVEPTAPGPNTGTIATAFNCVTGGQTAVIGRLHFIATAPGCLTQIDSSFPFATHVVSCGGEVDPVINLNRGSICAGSPGINACESAIPVEPTTWGQIKSQYND